MLQTDGRVSARHLRRRLCTRSRIVGREKSSRKEYEAGPWEAPQAIPRSTETVLGGWGPTHRTGAGAKLEGEESVDT